MSRGRLPYYAAERFSEGPARLPNSRLQLILDSKSNGDGPFAT